MVLTMTAFQEKVCCGTHWLLVKKQHCLLCVSVVCWEYFTQVMLPDSMPAQFQSTYTPIAAAGTDSQIKHVSRLLATQLTMAGMGKGVGELKLQVIFVISLVTASCSVCCCCCLYAYGPYRSCIEKRNFNELLFDNYHPYPISPEWCKEVTESLGLI